MDGLTLLREARAAGLTIEADGQRLRIRGPRGAEPLVQQLVANKTAVLSALAVSQDLGVERPGADEAAFQAAAKPEPSDETDETLPAPPEWVLVNGRWYAPGYVGLETPWD
jgi:hypothetical protein